MPSLTVAEVTDADLTVAEVECRTVVAVNVSISSAEGNRGWKCRDRMVTKQTDEES